MPYARDATQGRNMSQCSMEGVEKSQMQVSVMDIDLVFWNDCYLIDSIVMRFSCTLNKMICVGEVN